MTYVRAFALLPLLATIFILTVGVWILRQVPGQ